jgi:CRISPR/Cas system-associated protein endoribonuclease Cas2
LLPKGSVRTLQVTDRQYARMKLLLGEASFSEKRRRTSWFSSDFRLIHQAEIRGIPGRCAARNLPRGNR